MTTIPSLTPLPSPAPSTSDPTNFDARADALLGALPGMTTEQNAAIAAMNTVTGEVAANAAAAAAAQTAAQTAAQGAVAATGYVTESATSFSLTTGSKAFTTASGKSFSTNDVVTIGRKGDNTVRMYGTVTSYSGTALTINVTKVIGSGGPFTDWIISLSALVVDQLALTATAIAFAAAL